MSLSDIQGHAELEDTTEPLDLPPIIPNSELQLDADISCYYHAWTDISLGLCIEQLKKQIEMKRLLAGCEIVNIHTTHGAKAGRNRAAKVTMYQDTRKKTQTDPLKDQRVRDLRQFLQNYETDTVKAYPQFEIEADDSMAIRQRECIEQGIHSIIQTKDKDLDMCYGNHLDYDETDIKQMYFVPDGYGKLFLEETKKPADNTKGFTVKKKLKGYGTSFFWAQMLMGDTADSIPGLPKLSGSLLNQYQPTQATLKAEKNLYSGTPKQQEAALKVLNNRKAATVGQITAYNILKTCKNDQEAFERVREAYRQHYGTFEFEFEDWRGNITTETAGSMLLEQATLLWMLRTRDDSVVKFFKERLQ